MYQHYFIYAQKVGTKTFGGKPKQIIAENGIVINYCVKFAGMDVKTAVAKQVLELQESENYSRIVVRIEFRGKKIYDWRMDAERLAVIMGG